MAVALTLYTRPGCCLCDEMKAALGRAGEDVAFELAEVDVSGDRELERRYGGTIPVLAVGDEVLFEGRLTEEALQRELRRLAAGRSPRGTRASPEGGA